MLKLLLMSRKSRKVFRKWGCSYFYSRKNNVDFPKTCFLKPGCVWMRKYEYMYYVTSVYCMVQHIYIVIQSQRSYNTLRVKIIRATEGLQILLGRIAEFSRRFPKQVDEVYGICSPKDAVRLLFNAETLGVKQLLASAKFLVHHHLYF